MEKKQLSFKYIQHRVRRWMALGRVNSLSAALVTREEMSPSVSERAHELGWLTAGMDCSPANVQSTWLRSGSSPPCNMESLIWCLLPCGKAGKIKGDVQKIKA